MSAKVAAVGHHPGKMQARGLGGGTPMAQAPCRDTATT